MRDKVQIISIKGNEIKVIPLIIDSCINCTQSSCTKRGSSFIVSNPKNIAIKPGDVVHVNAPIKFQIIQAFTALLLPVTVAIGCYFISPPIEKIQSIFVICGFALSALLVTIVSRTLRPIKSEITSID